MSLDRALIRNFYIKNLVVLPANPQFRQVKYSVMRMDPEKKQLVKVVRKIRRKIRSAQELRKFLIRVHPEDLWISISEWQNPDIQTGKISKDSSFKHLPKIIRKSDFVIDIDLRDPGYHFNKILVKTIKRKKVYGFSNHCNTCNFQIKVLTETNTAIENHCKLSPGHNKKVMDVCYKELGKIHKELSNLGYKDYTFVFSGRGYQIWVHDWYDKFKEKYRILPARCNDRINLIKKEKKLLTYRLKRAGCLFDYQVSTDVFRVVRIWNSLHNTGWITKHATKIEDLQTSHLLHVKSVTPSEDTALTGAATMRDGTARESPGTGRSNR